MQTALRQLISLATLPVSAVMLDRTGTIMAVNDTWKVKGVANGLTLPNFGIGKNYLDYCECEDAHGARISTQLAELLAGRRDLVMQVYHCGTAERPGWYLLLAFPLTVGTPGPEPIALLHVDVSSFLHSRPLKSQDRLSSSIQKPEAEVKEFCTCLADTVENSVSTALTAQLREMIEGSDRIEPLFPSDSVRNGDARGNYTMLSKRQLEVFRLLGQGKTNQEIASALNRSPHTIKLHVSAILRRLKLNSRTQAALLASRLPWPS